MLLLHLPVWANQLVLGLSSDVVVLIYRTRARADVRIFGWHRRRAACLLPIVCQDNDYARGGASLEQRVVYRTCSRGECGCVGVVVSPPEQIQILIPARA